MTNLKKILMIISLYSTNNLVHAGYTQSKEQKKINTFCSKNMIAYYKSTTPPLESAKQGSLEIEFPCMLNNNVQAKINTMAARRSATLQPYHGSQAQGSFQSKDLLPPKID